VFVDESGDLGFTEKSPKFFIVAYIECESSLKAEVAMKRALKFLHKNKKYHYSRNELKFSRMNKKCREYVLQKINECDLNINVVVVEKAKVYPELRTNVPRLYNYFSVHYIMPSLLPQLATNRRLDIILDKSIPKGRTEDFNTYVKNEASHLLEEQGIKLATDSIVVSHVNSELEPCLQIADTIAGAYFQKYENNDDTYVDFITHKVTIFKIS
jgi:hypothetical protein